MLYCDWLVFNSCDWRISIPVVSMNRSLGFSLSYGSPVVILDIAKNNISKYCDVAPLRINNYLNTADVIGSDVIVCRHGDCPRWQDLTSLSP